MRDNILDKRFEGKAVRVYLLGLEEPIEGVIDEVSRFEIGMRTPKGPIVVFRHSIAYAEVSQAEVHGFSSEELDDVVITPEMTGSEVTVFLQGGGKLSGRITKVSRYEIGLRSGDRALIIPKSSISHVVFHGHQQG